MLQDIYNPLDEYVNVFRDRFKDIARSTFAQLAKEAQVDVDANRETCKQLYARQSELSSITDSNKLWSNIAVILIGGIIIGIIAIFGIAEEQNKAVIVAILISIVIAVILLFCLVAPRIQKTTSECNRLTPIVNELQSKAWQQMEPLNRLYDWDVLVRMMSEAVPRLEFDRYFTTQRLADLEKTYGWDGGFNKERSVIYSQSGLINGNPFVICRTRKMNMGDKTYYGHKTIYWTTRECGAGGKTRLVRHSQVLTASVTAPFPEYSEKTRLIYGNTAAPDLVFSRKKSGLASKEDSFLFRYRRRKLRKKARNLDSADFAMMTNEEFEVAFDTSDRNDNQQFALLFTPLAQQSMMSLLRDSEFGYGDDFDFFKQKMINTVIPNHLQSIELDMDPAQYRNFDYDKAEKDFYAINANCFRAIYFSLAPLLCIPAYQQIRPPQDIYGRDMQCDSSFWEHEALANFWGQERFKASDCVTDCILKTEQHKEGGGSSKITVYAYGYRAERHLTYINRFGGDGRMHKVPVYWDEYLPVTGSGCMFIKEDNDKEDFKSHSQRIEHISDVLGVSNFELYRRHIASKI